MPPEQGNLTYKLNIKLHTFQLTLSLSKTWGLDQKFYPTVRKSPHSKEITFQEDQIPYYFPHVLHVHGSTISTSLPSSKLLVQCSIACSNCVIHDIIGQKPCCNAAYKKVVSIKVNHYLVFHNRF